MKKILTKVISFAIVLSVLSTCVFADDLTILEGEQFNTFGSLTSADYGVNSVQWAATFTVTLNGSRESCPLSSSSPDYSYSASSPFAKITNAVVSIPAGTLVVSGPADDCFRSPSTSAAGVTVSASGSTLTIVSDGSTAPINISFSAKQSSTKFSLSGSFTPASPVEPGGDAGYPSGSMNGIQGWRYALSSAYQWETYNNYIGVRKIMYSLTFQGPDGGTSWNTSEVEGEELLYDMAVAISVNGYKWKVDATTGELVFYGYDGGMARSGSWLDMVFRYLTYDYFWGSRLWSNDVSGSWYGSISSSFSYLNYRVNQILEVLANDEDLEIKDATTDERNWVKDYFGGDGDKADSSKYDDLNNTGSAFKDAFAGAPDTSIADGFTAVNDNGYSFWSQEVSNDINGAGSVSTFSLDPSQQIVDAYSDNWEQIVGGYYD